MASEALVRRVRGEYHEMPGLGLTFDQACRLWHVDRATCAAVLARLTEENFLHRTRDGRYIAFPSTLPLKAQPPAIRKTSAARR